MDIAALVAINTMVGAGTVYDVPYLGRPLFCSTLDHPLFYDSATPPWVALPVGQVWQCGDLILVREHREDGTTRSLVAHVLDAGPFDRFCVRQPDGTCPPIVVDVPRMHATWDALSAQVEVINLSEIRRAFCTGGELQQCTQPFPPRAAPTGFAISAEDATGGAPCSSTR